MEIRSFPFPDTLCKLMGRAVNEAVARAIAEDMQRNGQLQDGMVAPDKDGKFVIIIGNHRWAACQLAGLPFRARILPVMPSQQEILRMQVSENLKRRSLSPFERASYIEQYRATLPKDATWAQVADGLGMKEATVLLHVAPRRIPERLRPLCEKLLPTAVCMIARIPKLDHMEKALEHAQGDVTNAQLEEFIKRLTKTVGRKNKHLTGKLDGKAFSIELLPGETAEQAAKRLLPILKRLRKHRNAPAESLGYAFA